MIRTILIFFVFSFLFVACSKSEEDIPDNQQNIEGFDFLSKVTGHWIGQNETSFQYYDWFAFDFRPISPSHTHSIYEGATQQSIINSFFVAQFEGEKQIMGRNGGWLGPQYRASYFVMDSINETNNLSYYRLVDAVGKEKRAFMEFRFSNDSMYFDAYKDNSGSLDDPILHMSFKGVNENPSFALNAIEQFGFPSTDIEIDLNDKFENLIDNDSALFLDEASDPFPKSMHGHISELNLNFERSPAISDLPLLLYLSKEPILSGTGQINFENLNDQLIRTINIQGYENTYKAEYLHPDNYYITVFSDVDQNFYPSSGDYSSLSFPLQINPESNVEETITIDQFIP